MSVPTSIKTKEILLSLDGNSFECQAQKFKVNNGTDDGERFYTMCPNGEFREDAEPDYSLELTFFADWRLAGISDWLWANDGRTVSFVLDHHTESGSSAQHVRWSGTLKVKAPSVDGEARKTEMTETTMPIVGKPTYLHL